jgi:hypothetical protein
MIARTTTKLVFLGLSETKAHIPIDTLRRILQAAVRTLLGTSSRSDRIESSRVALPHTELSCPAARLTEHSLVSAHQQRCAAVGPSLP